MPFKNNLIVKNNLIAIAIHICICFILSIPLILMWGNGVTSIFAQVTIGIYTIFALLLYFWAGKKFLMNMNNVLTNIFTVLALAIILIVTILVSKNPEYGEVILLVPIYPIEAIISYFLQIEGKYVFLILSFLPSLTMLAGMMTKRKESHLP